MIEDPNRWHFRLSDTERVLAALGLTRDEAACPKEKSNIQLVATIP